MFANFSGDPGKWFLTLSDATGDINYEQKCYNWYAQEYNTDASQIATLFQEVISVIYWATL